MCGLLVQVPLSLIFLLQPQIINYIFINTSDSFAIPIGGERVTWVCINLFLWPVKSVNSWAWHATLHLFWYDSFFIPFDRELQLKQLCHIRQYARRAQHSLIRSCLPESGGGLYHFIAGGVLCWKKSFNNYNFCIYFTFWPKVMMFLTEKVFMNGNQSVLNQFSTSSLNQPRPGSL